MPTVKMRVNGSEAQVTEFLSTLEGIDGMTVVSRSEMYPNRISKSQSGFSSYRVYVKVHFNPEKIFVSFSNE
jgi:hypothetical protein